MDKLRTIKLKSAAHEKVFFFFENAGNQIGTTSLYTENNTLKVE